MTLPGWSTGVPKWDLSCHDRKRYHETASQAAMHVQAQLLPSLLVSPFPQRKSLARSERNVVSAESPLCPQLTSASDQQASVLRLPWLINHGKSIRPLRVVRSTSTISMQLLDHYFLSIWDSISDLQHTRFNRGSKNFPASQKGPSFHLGMTSCVHLVDGGCR